MENQNKVEITYSPIPDDIALIIYGDRNKTLINIGDCSLFDVLTKIICETLSRKEEFGASVLESFQGCILSVYKYMSNRWKDKPADITYRKIYTSMRDVLLNKKTAEIYNSFIFFADEWFKEDFKGESMEKGVLRELIERLKEEENQETEIIKETDETIHILRNMIFPPGMLSKIQQIKKRLQIEGKETLFTTDVSLFCYGYIEGVRAERAKKRSAAQ